MDEDAPMGVLSADNPRDTALAWLFVAVQFALIVVIIVLPPGDAWPVPGWLATLGLVLEAIGVAVLVAGIVNLGRSLTPLPTPIDHAVLRVDGLYRWVRHPIYSGIMALVVGVSLRSANIAVVAASLCLIGWFMLKARWEEQHLARRYPDYAAYADRTPRFVPLWPPPSRSRTARGS
jgi:protein-S-isoprenylcysteine O-methyltransferase Ste14